MNELINRDRWFERVIQLRGRVFLCLCCLMALWVLSLILVRPFSWVHCVVLSVFLGFMWLYLLSRVSEWVLLHADSLQRRGRRLRVVVGALLGVVMLSLLLFLLVGPWYMLLYPGVAAMQLTQPSTLAYEDLDGPGDWRQFVLAVQEDLNQLDRKYVMADAWLESGVSGNAGPDVVLLQVVSRPEDLLSYWLSVQATGPTGLDYIQVSLVRAERWPQVQKQTGLEVDSLPKGAGQVDMNAMLSKTLGSSRQKAYRIEGGDILLMYLSGDDPDLELVNLISSSTHVFF